MPERKWTILVMSDEDSSIRQIDLTAKRIRAVIGVAVASVLGIFALAITLGNGGIYRVQSGLLERENAALERELSDVRAQVDQFEETLDGLSQRGTAFRLLAGLDTLDHELLQVGIGGSPPANPRRSELWATDSIAGQSVYALNYDLSTLERRAQLLSISLLEATDSLRVRRDLLESTPSILPTQGYISSGFAASRLHPIHNRALPHEGIDIAAPIGTPILAAAKGRVTFAGRRSGYGLIVEIDHGYGYVTRYGHASELLVRRGDSVARGDLIAKVGDTGIVTGPHLHYEVLFGGQPVNPANFIITRAIP